MNPRRLGLAGLLVGLFLLGWWAGRSGAKSTDLYGGLDVFVEVLHKVEENYVDPVQPGRLIDGAIHGLMRRLDPFSQYLDSRAYANLTSAIQGALGGIGVEVGVRDNYPTVIAPIEGTPAWRAGLQTGDIITRIEGQSTAGYSLEDVAAKLRGPKGTVVTVTVEREGEEPRDYTLTRDLIVTKSVPYAFMARERVGYVRLANFSEHSGTDVRRAVDALASRGARALVLDLRSNPGGLLNQAVSVAEQFLPPRTLVVYTHGRARGQDAQLYANEPRPRLDWPIVVLVDEGTASASEIVAGALQDLDRALVVGQRSYGKGSVQRVFPLRDGSAGLKLTTALYYTPSGRSIHRLPRPSDQDFSEDESQPGAPRDSARAPVFRTRAGRKLEGGGGIVPDVAVVAESLPPFTRQVETRGLAFRFVNRYVGRHPGAVTSFRPDAALWGEFAAFLAGEKVAAAPGALERERPRLERALERELARRLSGDSAAVRVTLRDDPVYQRALGVLAKAVRPQDVFTAARTR